MQPFPRPQSTPQAQITCGGCRTHLMYPQGAQNVRCARCGHITSVPPPRGSEMAQLVCSNAQCRVVLMYPRGAAQVQCSICGTLSSAVQANQVGHIICGGCQITLMYAFGAQSVKCAVCNHTTPVTAATTAAAMGRAGPQPAGGGAGSAKLAQQAVLVQNPSSLDDAGNEVQNVAIGVTTIKPELR